MTNKKLVFAGLVLLFALQLSLPAFRVLEQETVLALGTAYRFRQQFIDPYDPLLGQYTTLNLTSGFVSCDSVNGSLPEDGQAYAILAVDSAGFAYVSRLATNPPSGEVAYITCKTSPTTRQASSNPCVVYYELPVRRFFFEETSEIDNPEWVSWSFNSPRDTLVAEVKVYQGRATLTNVWVNGLPYREALIHRANNPQPDAIEAPTHNPDSLSAN
jgi:uncharacterized membrane-anchored protein